jgi:ribose transport system substrate-binding protein
MTFCTRVKPLALSVTTAVLLVGSASVAMAEVPSWCGPKQATLALLDGYGGNSWRQVTAASGAQTASLCPSITAYEYVDGQGDTQKSIYDIKATAAKGIDALVVFGDAGPAVLPAITQVYKSGKVIVPYRVVVGGKEGENYSKFVGTTFVDNGVSWGNWIKQQFPNGANLLYLSGPAGNSQGLEQLEGLKKVLGPEYKFVNPEPFAVTNWDPALTQKVLTAEIAKNDKIDVIVSDFGPSLVGALPLFNKQGKSIPALATSDGNSLGCLWHDLKDSNPDFKLFTVATGTDNVRLAVEWAVALATDGTPPDTNTYVAPAFEDSVSGNPNPVQCREDLPGAIYLSSALPAEDQAKAVAGQ